MLYVIPALLLLARPVLAQETAVESAPVPVGGMPASAVAMGGTDLLQYPIGARDTLAVEVYDEKSLSGTFVVDDGGTVDLPLLGRVHVTGMTLPEIDELLTRMLGREYLVNPQVTVRISSFGSKPVQILGGVGKPGTYYLAGPTTLLDVLTLAGGIKDTAAVEIRVQRPSLGGEPMVTSLDGLVAYGRGNVALEAGDIIYVPPGPVIYVSGEVGKPGTVPFQEGLLVMEAINRAGGANDQANLRKVYLLREGERTRINAKNVLKGRAADTEVRPDDHVYVSESVF